MFNKIRSYSYILFLILILTSLGSCSKQSPPGVTDPEVRNREDQERLNACSNVNFSKGIFLYQNVQMLFKCTKWNKEFPHMYDSMSKVTAESWDHVFSPINLAFMENLERRDRLFRNIRDLDSKNGLDDLSYVIVALNETNFFDSVKAMFKCVENPNNELCINRKNIPTKSSLKNIIHLIDFNPGVVADLSTLLKEMLKVLAPKQEEYRREVDKFRFANNYIPIRLRMIDAIANKVKAGFSDEDRKFLKTLLTVGSGKNTDNPWIYEWLKDEKLGRNKFRDLIEFPILVHPEISDEVEGIRQLYDIGFSCTLKNNDAANDILDFDIRNGIGEYVRILKEKDYKAFFDYSSVHITGMKASAEICKELVHNQYNANLINAATKIATFLSEKKNYELIKFILNFSTAKNDSNNTFAENIYFGDLLSGNIFRSFNKLNAHISFNTRDFFPLVYDLLVKMPPSSIVSISNLVSEISRVENDAKFIGVADFWSFFNNEEKNFVFNFIDRHFDKDINYTLLFDFYAKSLDDFEDVQPIFKDAWTGSEMKDEESYLALQDFFYHFSGKDTLLDFKKFFSRDQILKVLEVISNGQKINSDARAEIAYRDSTDYLSRTKIEKFKYNVIYDPNVDMSYDARAVVRCMQIFNDMENGFYELVLNLPEACKQVSKDNISFRLFGWMNAISSNYSQFKPIKNWGLKKETLFDGVGILSPYMLNTNIGLIKILDNVLGPVGGSEPTRNGIEYLLGSFNYYLNERKGIEELNKDIQLLESYLNVISEKNTIFRNSLLKSYVKENNFVYTRNVLSNLADLTIDFGNWIKSGAYQKAVTRSLGTFDPNNTCEKSINQFIAPYPCPSKENIKLWGSDLLFLLQNVWEKGMGSPVKYLLTGIKAGEGLDIPLYGRNTIRYRLSLNEAFRYMFDTFDRSLPVNNQFMKYENEKGQKEKSNITTIERVETVIREVRFGNNYLGATYLNHVVEGDDYKKDVAERKRLLSSCVKIPGIRCGRSMSDSDLRMAKNSLEAFDSLLDVDNARGLESKLIYGNFLKTLQQTLIASSSKEAQAVTFFPLNDEILKQHNGRVLTDITMINGFSNMSRVLKDRIGRTREEFNRFLNREDFKRVDRTLMAGFDLPTAIPSAERLINKLKTIPSGERQNLFGNLVDWIAGLNYEETRLVEDTVARMMVVGSFLGTPDRVYDTNLSQEDLKKFERYENNNIFQVFLALERVIDYWPSLKNFFPADAKLIDAIKPANIFLYYLTEKLNSNLLPGKNKIYIALNDLFSVLQSTLFESVEDGRVMGKTGDTYKGLDFIVEGLKKSSLVVNSYNAIRSNYKYSDVFFENNGQFFLSFGENLKRMSSNSRIDMAPIQDYLGFTSKNATCVAGDSKCMENYHYDELFSLIKFLNVKDDNGKNNLQLANQKFFQENYKDIVKLIDDSLACLKIKSVRMPIPVN